MRIQIARARRRRAWRSSRSRISPAALFVNVIARISFGSTPQAREQVRDAVGEDARLAGARAGDHEQRPLGGRGPPRAGRGSGRRGRSRARRRPRRPMLAAEREPPAEHGEAAEAGGGLERRDHGAVERVALHGGLEPDDEGDGERDAAGEAATDPCAEPPGRRTGRRLRPRPAAGSARRRRPGMPPARAEPRPRGPRSVRRRRTSPRSRSGGRPCRGRGRPSSRCPRRSRRRCGG